VAQLRPRQRESEPARLRRLVVTGAGAQHRSAALFPSLGQRLPALELSGACASALGPLLSCISRTPPA
jgi:hypothetical protein